MGALGGTFDGIYSISPQISISVCPPISSKGDISHRSTGSFCHATYTRSDFPMSTLTEITILERELHRVWREEPRSNHVPICTIIHSRIHLPFNPLHPGIQEQIFHWRDFNNLPLGIIEQQRIIFILVFVNIVVAIVFTMNCPVQKR